MTTFDVHAPGYDAVAASPLGVSYRDRVRALVVRALDVRALDVRAADERVLAQPGSSERALDLGCGTGLDALWLANRGFEVRGFDASAEMVDHARRRIANAGERASIDQRDLNEAEPLGDPSSIDLVLANFGVVNCITDLEAFGSRLADVTRPGAVAVIVTMPRLCPTEWAQAVATATPALARRRRDGVAAGDYEGLPLRYRDARAIVEALSDHFDLIACEALGTVAPTFEQRRLVDTRPRLLAALDRADRFVSPVASRLGVGDHHAVALRRRDR